MAQEDTWCLIESDPGVFWEIARTLGVRGLDFQEVYSLSPDELKQLCPDGVLGLVFLFRWHPHLKDVLTGLGSCLNEIPSTLFYAKQVIQNSCATQAMLSIVLNQRSKISIGPTLESFYQFTANMTPEMCGFCLANQSEIRDAHNAYRSVSALSIGSEHSSGGKEDPFHFVSFLPDEETKNVFLLDGLMEGPLLLGKFDATESWVDVALPAVQKIIAALQVLPTSENRDASTDIRFNLIAALPDMQEKQLSEKRRLQQELAQSLRALLLVESQNDPSKLAKYKLSAVSPEEFAAQPPADESKSKIAQLTLQLEGLTRSLESISKRHESWTRENSLRQHDLMPFYLSALKHLAKRRLLSPAYEEAALRARGRGE